MSVFTNISARVRDALGKKALNQLLNAEAKNTCFLESRVFSNWFEPYIERENSYIPLSDNKFRQGRNHLWNQYLADCEFDPAIAGQTEFFTNPLNYPVQDECFGAGRNGPNWGPAPSSRTANGGIAIITAELDVSDPIGAATMLRVQLDAMRSNSKPENSMIGEFDKLLRIYNDYRGVVATWSGNKSIHFHFGFVTGHLCSGQGETRHAVEKWSGDITSNQLAALYKSNAALVLRDLRLQLGIKEYFDDSLTSWCSYRRMPGGSRISSDSNLFDIPAGIRVPQFVLLDLSRDRAPNGATAFLFDLDRVPEAEFTSHSSPRAKSELTAAIHDDVLSRLQDVCFAEWGCEFPKPVRLEVENGEPVCYFANHENDGNPSSVMRAEWNGVALAGSHSFDRTFALPKSLIDYLVDLTEQTNAVPIGVDLNTLTELERAFYLADDADDCRQIFSEAASDLLAGDDRLVLIQAPEGLGKTTSILNALAASMSAKPVQNLASLKAAIAAPHGFKCFSAPSYRQQAEKAQAIEKTGLRAVKIESASRLYDQARLSLKLDKITLDYAAMNDEAGWWSCVRAEQPDVIELMAQMVTDAWGNAPFDPKRTVLVTVHAVTESWMMNGPTRALWNPNWTPNASREDEKKMRDRMELSLIIFDEVDVSNLTHHVAWNDAAVAMRCLNAFDKQNPESSIFSSSLEQKYAAHQAGVSVAIDYPLESGEAEAAINFDFNQFIDFLQMGMGATNIIEINTTSHLFGRNGSARDIYQARNGDRFLIKAKNWFFTNPAKMIFLTTESLPVGVAKSITSGNESFVIHDLTSSPAIPRSSIPIYVNKLVSKDKKDEDRLSALINEKRNLYPDCVIISDNAAHISGSISHKSARGSNDYASRDIVSFYPMIPPQQYAGLVALGQAYEISDPISAHYFDQINQSIGRNKGYRNTNAAHEVQMHPSVYKLISNSSQMNSNRYQFTRIKTAKQLLAA